MWDRLKRKSSRTAQVFCATQVTRWISRTRSRNISKVNFKETSRIIGRISESSRMPGTRGEWEQSSPWPAMRNCLRALDGIFLQFAPESLFEAMGPKKRRRPVEQANLLE